MNAVIYVGPQDEDIIDLAAVSEHFSKRTGVSVEFTRKVVKPRMEGHRPIIVLDGGATLAP